MNWKAFAVQFLGQALLGSIAWYWLNLGVGSAAMVAANAGIAIVLLLGWTALVAYGLGAIRNWVWAIPAVALTPLMVLHVVAAILIPILWILLLFPSAAAGRLRLKLDVSYMGVCLAMLLVMTVMPAALLNWIPSVGGLTPQAISFGARSLLAYAIFTGSWAALLQFICRQTKAEQQSGIPYDR